MGKWGKGERQGECVRCQSKRVGKGKGEREGRA